MKNLIVFGAPGCGKGTQSKLIVDRYGFVHISTGELLRGEITKKTPLGKLADKYMSKGHLIPDEIIIDIVADKVEVLHQANTEGVVFDGFPRTLPQAEALERIFEKYGLQTSALLDIQVEDEELIKRLLLRGEISKRSDDNRETITERLKVYEQKTRPLVDFYKSIGKYEPIDGIGDVDTIFERVAKVIEK